MGPDEGQPPGKEGLLEISKPNKPGTNPGLGDGQHPTYDDEWCPECQGHSL